MKVDSDRTRGNGFKEQRFRLDGGEALYREWRSAGEAVDALSWRCSKPG